MSVDQANPTKGLGYGEVQDRYWRAQQDMVGRYAGCTVTPQPVYPPYDRTEQMIVELRSEVALLRAGVNAILWRLDQLAHDETADHKLPS
jgi:hypothetical protein